MKVSAVVCTRNRSPMALRAVQSLLDQSASHEDFEILVIDNGSTDDTVSVIERLAKETGRVRLVVETQTGIAHARNAGYLNAQGDYVAFIDDDAAAEPDWIETILRLLSDREQPLIALGGKILPLYEAPKPQWFLDRYEERSWGDSARELREDESFSASNMVIARQALVDVGGFVTSVGMKGDRLMIGEEPMLFASLWQKLPCQGRILYDPALRVRHSVPAAKMTLGSMWRRKFVAGQYAARTNSSRGPRRLVAALRALVSAFVKMFQALVLILKVKDVRRWVFEGLGLVAEPIGRFLSLIGIEPKLRRS